MRSLRLYVYGTTDVRTTEQDSCGAIKRHQVQLRQKKMLVVDFRAKTIRRRFSRVHVANIPTVGYTNERSLVNVCEKLQAKYVTLPCTENVITCLLAS